jgi:phage terminase large subunit-like protein
VTGYDQRFAKDFIKRMDEYGFETEMIYQNRFVLTNPMKLAEAEIDAGMVCFSNPIDLWCLSNTAIQVWDTGHVMPVKIKNRPGKKIDGTLSLIDVYEIYRRYKSDFMQMQS